MIALLLANGFEEIEALTPVDLLRRMNADVKTIGIGGKTVVGSHGITVTADLTDEEAASMSFEHLILPGGMPGTVNLDSAPITDKLIKDVISSGGRIAAICAAPLILGRRGLLCGKRAVCYPGFENELDGAIITDAPVVTDENITTAKGMGAALPFAKEIVSLFLGKCKSEVDDLAASIMEA